MRHNKLSVGARKQRLQHCITNHRITLDNTQSVEVCSSVDVVLQARRDEAIRAQLARKTANKMARAELIEAQRQALLLEMQHIRKDILQQEAWLRVRHLPPPNPSWVLRKLSLLGLLQVQLLAAGDVNQPCDLIGEGLHGSSAILA